MRGRWSKKRRCCKPARAVQAHLAEALAQDLDPALELGAVGRADRDAEIGAQHRRVGGGLQDGLVLAGQLAVLLGLPARTGLRALGLLAPGVLGVEDSLANLAQRLAVADPARVQDGVGREARVFEGREEQLRVAGELGLLGERRPRRGRPGRRSPLRPRPRARAARRGPRSSARWRSARDRARAARGVCSSSPYLDNQGVGLPVRLQLGLGDTTTGGAAQQPLEILGRGPAQAEQHREPLEAAPLGRGELAQLGAGDRARASHSGDLLHPAPRPVERAQLAPSLARRARRRGRPPGTAEPSSARRASWPCR